MQTRKYCNYQRAEAQLPEQQEGGSITINSTPETKRKRNI